MCCSLEHAESILPSVAQLLPSSKSSDEIFNELLNLLGYDHIELSMSIIEHRQDLGELVRAKICTRDYPYSRLLFAVE